MEKSNVLIGITGSIAAYKMGEVVSSLAKQDIPVKVIMTESSSQFVSPLTFATLSRQPVYTDRDFWQPHHGRPLHISLGEWADLFLIAPLSANSLAKLALGLADNLLLNTVLASHCPIVLAPAMNTTMWTQPIVQGHIQSLLAQNRFVIVPPTSGLLACDTIGTGRMAEPRAILRTLESIAHTKGVQDLQGKRVLVTAGGTREFLDPVRFIGNPSTGKQGIAIAESALHRGAEVTLIHSNIENIPNGLNSIGVTSALEMTDELLRYFPNHDWLIMCAAVGDVRPANYVNHKIPKSELTQHLALEQVPDILQLVNSRKTNNQIVIGFAAQTGTDAEILNKGQEKLTKKGLNTIVINAIDREGQGFGTETNSAILLDKSGYSENYSSCSKLELGHHLLDFILKCEQN